MTRLFLVTGFLGAGKTTFLRNLVALYPEQSKALIINEFGAAGVDGAILSDLGVALTEIDNGSIFCACRLEQFEAAILAALRRKPGLIFVEASGLSDPTAIRGILGRREKFADLSYAGSICLADAARFEKVYGSALVSRMQLAVSDLVLINKCDLASREQIDAIRAAAEAQKPGRPVFETTFGAVRPEWLDAMERPVPDDRAPGIRTRDVTLQRLTVAADGFSLGDFTSFLQMFAADAYRVKGVALLREGPYLADCVGPIVAVRPWTGVRPEAGRLNVLFGNGLPARKSVARAIGSFPQYGAKIV